MLKAKQEGQAALERARGESASLRNLANAARVLEGNPALMKCNLRAPLAQQFGRRFAKPQRLVRFQHGIPFRCHRSNRYRGTYIQFMLAGGLW